MTSRELRAGHKRPHALGQTRPTQTRLPTMTPHKRSTSLCFHPCPHLLLSPCSLLFSLCRVGRSAAAAEPAEADFDRWPKAATCTDRKRRKPTGRSRYIHHREGHHSRVLLCPSPMLLPPYVHQSARPTRELSGCPTQQQHTCASIQPAHSHHRSHQHGELLQDREHRYV